MLHADPTGAAPWWREILIAVIAALGGIIVALIGAYFSNNKSSDDRFCKVNPNELQRVADLFEQYHNASERYTMEIFNGTSSIKKGASFADVSGRAHITAQDRMNHMRNFATYLLGLMGSCPKS